MSAEIEKIKDFLFLKRASVQKTIDDENSTILAIIIFITTVVLAGIQSFLIVNSFEWMFDLIATYVTYTPPSLLKMIFDAITNIISPVIAVILSFYIGNAIKGEAESLKHVIRAIGYSFTPLLLINILSFLYLANNIIIDIIVAGASVILALWFVVVIVFALMLTFKKGALTGIIAILGGLIIAGIIFSWTVFIP